MLVAEAILYTLLAYVLCGLVVGVPFIVRGVERIDPAAYDTSWGFRLLLLPGTVALWPLVTLRWLRAPHQEHHS